LNLEEFLYQVADRLRSGDYLDPDVILPVLDESREHLEEMAAEVEANPSPAGLEALDDATLEAYNLFAEALDLLELAVEEGIPELGPEILIRTQDGKETLREVRRQAEVHSQAIQEEVGLRG